MKFDWEVGNKRGNDKLEELSLFGFNDNQLDSHSVSLLFMYKRYLLTLFFPAYMYNCNVLLFEFCRRSRLS